MQLISEDTCSAITQGWSGIMTRSWTIFSFHIMYENPVFYETFFFFNYKKKEFHKNNWRYVLALELSDATLIR